jgi:hypothetical protein
MPPIPATQEAEAGELRGQEPSRLGDHISTSKFKKKDWSMAQVVEHLPSMCEALRSIPKEGEKRENKSNGNDQTDHQ